MISSESNQAAVLALVRLQTLLRNGGRAVATGIGSGAAFLLSELFDRLGGVMLVIGTGPTQTKRLGEDIAYFIGGERPLFLPAYETLPFERESPSPEETADRIFFLDRLAARRPGIYLAPACLLSQQFMPQQQLLESSFSLQSGAALDQQETAGRLEALGYRRVGLVENHGEYGIRGNILDLFSAGWDRPLRLELADDIIESMRWFDTADQRSLETAGDAHVLPLTEICGDGCLRLLQERLQSFGHGRLGSETALGRLSAEINDLGLRPWHAGLLPLCYEAAATLLDYCPPGGIVAVVDPVEATHQAQQAIDEIRHEGLEAGYPEEFIQFLTQSLNKGADALRRRPDGHAILEIHHIGGDEADSNSAHLSMRPVAQTLMADGSIHHRGGWRAAERIKEWGRAATVVIVCRTAGSARRLREILAEYDIGCRLFESGPFDPGWLTAPTGTVVVHVGDLHEGFAYPAAGLTLISEDDLFGSKRRLQERRSARAPMLDLDFSTLRTGDFLVHEEHGIGLYGGVTALASGSGTAAEMLTILYADEGRLYVPMDRLYLVQKYLCAEGITPRLDRIGGKAWHQTKTKAKRAIRTMVRDLLRIQAKRKMAVGQAFSPDSAWQKEFEAAFDYDETPDQMRTIEEVKRDMESPRPMDRLVCGDVGYGKTEVAMRAAFKAVNEGFQTAVLAPTTVLCQQHHLTFSRRFAPFPVRIEVLSRFTTPKGKTAVLAGLADGGVDIVIGTHSILQKGVRFRNLGLVIVDEEHRFGVKDKERLKELRASVNVLSLSATPIPRTFSMAMAGLRELSVIETPPENRLAVKTKVLPFSANVIRDAIMREKLRGGQTFFLHNRIKGIEAIGRFLSKIVPEATVAVAHGRMPEKTLERVMAGFVAGEYDVLLSTSIIESGLDIPNANTMIINRADRFGLADLYQLRGRIGRSSHQAFAYLMVPGGSLTATARQRLSAIEEFSQLGAGLQLAALDLEIRGAGNLLGYEQSGRMAEVGLEMYTRMLEETVAELKGEAGVAKSVVPPEIAIPYPAYLDKDYLSDTNQRLTTYKRLSLVESEEDLLRLSSELEDIFGHIPEAARNLLSVVAVRLAAQNAGVTGVVVNEAGAELTFSRATPVDPARVLALIGSSGGALRFRGESRLFLALDTGRAETALTDVKNLLRSLVDCANVNATLSPS